MLNNFLNSITMYRLVLVCLSVMAVFAIVFGFLGLVPFDGIELISSLVLINLTCYFSNILFARIFKVPINVESSLITALILFFVISPDQGDLLALGMSGVIAMASKYFLAYHRKHIFNPVALSALISGLTFSGVAIWWVANIYLLPLSLISGFLILKKIRRFPMFFIFLAGVVLTTILLAVSRGVSIIQLLEINFISYPLIFFAAFMLTEPITTPPREKHQLIYGLLIGVLASWPFSLGPLYSSPELALLIGNLYSYAVGFRKRLYLKLIEKEEIAKDTYEFVFEPDREFSFEPGQYMEWTLPHKNPDSRGNRRFFTIASDPADKFVRLGVRFCDNPSSFKKKLLSLKKGDRIIAGQVAGDFVMPKDSQEKSAFIAGGIGVTPFISMIRTLGDGKPDLMMFYCNKSESDIAYKEIVEKIRVEHLIGEYLTAEKIKKNLPDFKERTFYISGPIAMVNAYKKTLKEMGVKKIKTDYFPGFA